MQPDTRLRARRIGLNAHLLNLSGNYRSAGINWYIFHLLQNLDPAKFDFTVFLSDPRAREHFCRLRLVQSRWPTHRPVARICWEQFVLPLALRQARIELAHALAFAGPLVNSIPWIVTIYDLSFVRYPESFNAANRIYLNWAVRHSVRRADRVIAISESTKRDLVAQFGASPDKVAVVYCGSDPTFTPSQDQREVEMLRARRHLPEKMILHVGTIEPRKNIVRLLRAFARAKREARLPHRLALIGARGWKYAEVDAVIAAEGIASDVIFAGYVPQDELPLWYRAADLFVYPSLYEGFGLPPLEAMASGTPVVTSNAASLPEVVGDAALVVSPEDEAALAAAIVRALEDDGLRQELRARGLVQSAKFSWARAARETMDLYDAVLRGANYAAA
ncbi:MAG: glycosyltransferase family 4 protein [Chloroflexi bacterium]|nr:glycosyltransferase family 4 protein [Chloroflexota bacterium]